MRHRFPSRGHKVRHDYFLKTSVKLQKLVHDAWCSADVEQPSGLSADELQKEFDFLLPEPSMKWPYSGEDVVAHRTHRGPWSMSSTPDSPCNLQRNRRDSMSS